VGAVFDLVATPKAVFELVRYVVILLLLLPAAVFLIHPAINPDSPAFRFLATVYSFPLAVVLGIVVWTSEFIRRSFSKVLLVVDLLLDTTQRIAKDYSKLYAGEQKMPPLMTLVGDVYEKLLLKILREAVDKHLGLIGKPVYFTYRLTIDRVLKILLRRNIDKSLNENIGEDGLQEIASGIIKDVRENESKINQRLQAARDRIKSTAGKLKALIMWPCYAVVVFISLIVLIPLAILFLW